MKSTDYLYEILRKPSAGRDGWLVAGKRYCVGTVPPAIKGGAWREAICRCRYQTVFMVTEPFATAEEAWEDFLARKHPDVLAKWQQAQSAAESKLESAVTV